MKQSVRALDVVPGKWYMARARVNSKDITWQPCQVTCTTAPAISDSGSVDIQFTEYWPKVVVTFADTCQLPSSAQRGAVFIQRNAQNEWVFEDSSGNPSLIELDVSLLNRILKRFDDEIASLTKRKLAAEEVLKQVKG